MPTSPAQIETTLRELTFAAEWPDGLRHEAAAMADEVCFAAGTIIFRSGQSHDRVYLIRNGLVALEMGVPARGSSRLLTLGPGDLLGWSPLLGQQTMTATALALEDTEVYSLPGPALLALCQTNHEFGFAVMSGLARSLARRLTAARLQLLDLYSPMPPEFRTEGI